MKPTYHGVDELPLTLSIDDLMPILGIGRNTAYKLVRSGKIQSIRVGKQIRISKAALLKFVNPEG